MIRIYTDGACSGNPGPGGWGVLMNENAGCKNISGGENETTNNRMELKAVIEAMKLIITHSNEKREFYYQILSDSAYTINAINNEWVYKWCLNGWKTVKGDDVKNKDLWMEYLELKSKLIKELITVEFVKVKGHAGNTFNEYVDKLARAEAVKRIT